MRKVLVTGMSGTGKSTALAELRKRGFEVVDTDEPGWSEWSVEEDGLVWHEDRMTDLLGHNHDATLYVSGTVSNQGRFYPRFDAVVLLSAPVEVMLDRIASRTTNDYGKTAKERELILGHLAEVEPLLRATCTHEIDAARPIDEVVDELVAIGRLSAGIWFDGVVREIAEGLWHWTTPHPAWESSEPWDEEVSSYATDDGERLLLFDPLGVPGELEERAADRETLIVLTSPWHERDTRSLVERLAAPVYTPRPDSAQDLIDKYGITPEQAGDGSPDLGWLLTGEAGEGRYYAAGDQPFGAQAFPGREPNDLVLWFERWRMVVSGDTLVDFGQGLEIHADWLRPNVSREQVIEGLRPLLELPVDHVLATHGGPTDRAALERALA